MLNNIPKTRIKILLANVLYRVITLFFNNAYYIISRKGINYEVDLSEGLDLSLFLFGGFQNYITSNKYIELSDDAVVFDVGANIGSMTLRYAAFVPNGKVYSFEPATYAYKKLLRNISLNPLFAKRIIPVQQFVSDRSGDNHNMKAYSSWKVDGSAINCHPLHGGTVRSGASVSAMSLDDYCDKNNISWVNLIKIDTEGYELRVLLGASKLIKKSLPFIILELSLYHIEEQGITFEDYYDFFSTYKYELISIKSGQKICNKNFLRQIPLRSTVDIVAIPPKREI